MLVEGKLKKVGRLLLIKKVLINRVPRNSAWGGGNLLVKALCEYGKNYGIKFVHELSPDLDAILMVDPRPDELGIGANEIWNHKQKYNTKIIHRVNECDARKGTHDMDILLKNVSTITDFTIFVSNWMRDYFLQDWHCKDFCVLINGVEEHFQSQPKLNNGKINIVIHHWSDNKFKNMFTKQIDEFIGKYPGRYTFTYIGRAPSGLKHTNLIAPLYGKELGNELGKYDICINSSTYDPGPNSILESLACGLPTYAWINGGGAAEFVGEDHLYNSWEDIENILLSQNYIKNTKCVSLKSWEECVKEYCELIHDVVGEKEEIILK